MKIERVVTSRGDESLLEVKGVTEKHRHVITDKPAVRYQHNANVSMVPYLVVARYVWGRDGWLLTELSLDGFKIKKDGKPGEVVLSNREWGSTNRRRAADRDSIPEWAWELADQHMPTETFTVMWPEGT